MGMSRREVLRVGTMATLSARLPWLVGGGAVAVAGDLPLSARALRGLNALTRADFAAAVGSRFRFSTSGGGRVTTRLAGVTGTGGAQRDSRCFALRFRSRASRRLTQGTYLVGHPVLGEFALFVVPMGARGRRAFYEAVINRADA